MNHSSPDRFPGSMNHNENHNVFDDRELAQTIGRFNQTDQNTSEMHRLLTAKYKVCFQLIQSAGQKYDTLQHDLLKTKARWLESYQFNKTLNHSAKQRSQRAVDHLSDKSRQAFTNAKNAYENGCAIRKKQQEWIEKSDHLLSESKTFFDSLTPSLTQFATTYTQLNQSILQVHKIRDEIAENLKQVEAMKQTQKSLVSRIETLTSQEIVQLDKEINELHANICKVEEQKEKEIGKKHSLNSTIAALQLKVEQSQQFQLIIAILELLTDDQNGFFVEFSDNQSHQLKIQPNEYNIVNYFDILSHTDQFTGSQNQEPTMNDENPTATTHQPLQQSPTSVQPLPIHQIVSMYQQLSPLLQSFSNRSNFNTFSSFSTTAYDQSQTVSASSSSTVSFPQIIPQIYLHNQLENFFKSQPQQIETLMKQVQQMLCNSLSLLESDQTRAETEKRAIESTKADLIAQKSLLENQLNENTSLNTQLSCLVGEITAHVDNVKKTMELYEKSDKIREILHETQAIEIQGQSVVKLYESIHQFDLNNIYSLKEAKKWVNSTNFNLDGDFPQLSAHNTSLDVSQSASALEKMSTTAHVASEIDRDAETQSEEDLEEEEEAQTNTRSSGRRGGRAVPKAAKGKKTAKKSKGKKSAGGKSDVEGAGDHESTNTTSEAADCDMTDKPNQQTHQENRTMIAINPTFSQLNDHLVKLDAEVQLFVMNIESFFAKYDRLIPQNSPDQMKTQLSSRLSTFSNLHQRLALSLPKFCKIDYQVQQQLSTLAETTVQMQSLEAKHHQLFSNTLHLVNQIAPHVPKLLEQLNEQMVYHQNKKQHDQLHVQTFLENHEASNDATDNNTNNQTDDDGDAGDEEETKPKRRGGRKPAKRGKKAPSRGSKKSSGRPTTPDDTAESTNQTDLLPINQSDINQQGLDNIIKATQQLTDVIQHFTIPTPDADANTIELIQPLFKSNPDSQMGDSIPTSGPDSLSSNSPMNIYGQAIITYSKAAISDLDKTNKLLTNATAILQSSNHDIEQFDKMIFTEHDLTSSSDSLTTPHETSHVKIPTEFFQFDNFDFENENNENHQLPTFSMEQLAALLYPNGCEMNDSVPDETDDKIDELILCLQQRLQFVQTIVENCQPVISLYTSLEKQSEDNMVG